MKKKAKTNTYSPEAIDSLSEEIKPIVDKYADGPLTSNDYDKIANIVLFYMLVDRSKFDRIIGEYLTKELKSTILFPVVPVVLG